MQDGNIGGSGQDAVQIKPASALKNEVAAFVQFSCRKTALSVSGDEFDLCPVGRGMVETQNLQSKPSDAVIQLKGSGHRPHTVVPGSQQVGFQAEHIGAVT